MAKRKALSDAELDELMDEDQFDLEEIENESSSDSDEEQFLDENISLNDSDEEPDEINLDSWKPWTDNESQFKIFPFNENVGYHPPRINQPVSELDFFQLFFTDELLQAIVDETNRYVVIYRNRYVILHYFDIF